METVQQNSRITLFSSKFHSNIYSFLFNGGSLKITPTFPLIYKEFLVSFMLMSSIGENDKCNETC